MELGAM
jgi:hypothetical protein